MRIRQIRPNSDGAYTQIKVPAKDRAPVDGVLAAPRGFRHVPLQGQLYRECRIARDYRRGAPPRGRAELYRGKSGAGAPSEGQMFWRFCRRATKKGSRMADYYALIARTVVDLKVNAEATRR